VDSPLDPTQNKGGLKEVSLNSNAKKGPTIESNTFTLLTSGNIRFSLKNRGFSLKTRFSLVKSERERGRVYCWNEIFRAWKKPEERSKF
jgi:hypothetical protein